MEVVAAEQDVGLSAEISGEQVGQRHRQAVRPAYRVALQAGKRQAGRVRNGS